MNIDDAIARVSEGLTNGEIGYMGLYSQEQQNYHAMWSQLCDYVAELSNADFEKHFELRQRVQRIADETIGQSVPIFAVNTTKYDVAIDKQYEGY
jgi:hypothetical protein